MTIFSFSNPRSVVNFCRKQFNPETLQTEKDKHRNNCLSAANRDHYVQLLREGDYLDVIGAIWKDARNRLEFLLSHRDELHAPLMFEEAIERFRKDPRKEIAMNVCFPLIQAAMFRVRQDAVCSPDVSVSSGDSHQRMGMVYTRILSYYFQHSFGKAMPRPSDRVIREKVEEVARASINRELPPAKWVGEHGVAAFMGGVEMKAEASHSALRNNFARKVLREELGVREGIDADEEVKEDDVQPSRIERTLHGPIHMEVRKLKRHQLSCCQRVTLLIKHCFSRS